MDPSAPPRLIAVIPRRSLVDQIADEISSVVASLDSPNRTELMGEVRNLLLSRRQNILGLLDESPAAVVSLRGGMPKAERNTSWVDDPNMCAVITATPQCAVSTLLFNSYLFPPKAHAVYAGLFAVGVRVIFDEAHLQRQAVATFRSAERIVNKKHEELGILSAGMSVTEMTATPTEDMPYGDDRLEPTNITRTPFYCS